MKRWARLLSIPTLLLPLLALPRPCLACSCMPPDPKEHFALADVIVRGRVVEVEALPRWQQYLPRNWDDPYRTKARLRIDAVWKGPTQAEVLVAGGSGAGDCSVAFHEGADYIVYGQRRGGDVVSTNICLGTLSTDHARETVALLAALGPATPVAVSAPAPPRASIAGEGLRWPWLAGAVGLAAIGAVAIRKHRGVDHHLRRSP